VSVQSFGITAIASVVPARQISNLDPSLLASFDIDETFIRDKIGVLRRTVMAEGEDTSDLAAAALAALLKQTGVAARDIDVLIVVTQNPDSNLPHVSALVHGKLGLSARCAAFDLGLGCSGYVYGLGILQSFMYANAAASGVLITADPYSKIIDPNDKNTVLLFGDAATATLMTANPVLRLGPFSYGTDGSKAEALRRRNGRLSMKGRDIFNFAVERVPADVEHVLKQAGLTIADIDAVYFHQGSRFIIEMLAKRLGTPLPKIRMGMEETGNTVSSSIPLLLEQDLGDRSINKALLSGFGVGLSWASCICERIVND
jgi:3-oxoacyl-[acyl-carrier-protein] synthase-3